MNTVFPISCLGSCYASTSSHELCCSIESLFLTSFSPSQIVLVVDGPVPADLSLTIDHLELQYESLNVLRIKSNIGLGGALRKGLQLCSHELVFRFDTDDISLSTRLPAQYHYLISNPQVSCCGSDVLEFRRDANSSYVRLKSMPKRLYLLQSFFRNPLNHPTVAFRKQDILIAGGYIDCNFFEDYSLWIRLIICGFKITNLSTPPLVCMDRPNLQTRRSGFGYLLSELSFAFSLHSSGFASFPFQLSIVFRAFLRYFFGTIFFSTPWRSSWVLIDDKYLSNIPPKDAEAIAKRFSV